MFINSGLASDLKSYGVTSGRTRTHSLEFTNYRKSISPLTSLWPMHTRLQQATNSYNLKYCIYNQLIRASWPVVFFGKYKGSTSFQIPNRCGSFGVCVHPVLRIILAFRGWHGPRQMGAKAGTCTTWYGTTWKQYLGTPYR